jgi:hypothetical protein
MLERKHGGAGRCFDSRDEYSNADEQNIQLVALKSE